MGFFKSVFKAVSSVVSSVVKVVSKAISWIAPQPQLPDFGTGDFGQYETGVLLNKSSNDANIPIVYGKRLIGGTRVFVETSGTDNNYLYMALVICEGEINDIKEIRIDEKTVTWSGDLQDNVQRTVDSSDTNFYKNGTSHITVEPHYGTDGQSASSLLSTLTNWTSNHKLSGLCYLALRFTWNQDVFSNLPKVQVVLEGKKISTFDSGGNETTGQYSTNPAWCLLDYLRNSRYGKGLSLTDIDLSSFYTASQICVTQVTPYSGGSDINIFDCNGVVDTSKRIIENVRGLLKGCRGYLPYTQGKYKLVVETTGTATVSLTEDNLYGGFILSSETKNDKYNRVIVSFVNPDKNYQVDEAQFPPVDDSGEALADRHATMLSADGGFLLEGRFDFPSITNVYQAQEMAEIILRRSRDALKLDINCDGTGYDLVIGDIVNITHASLGFSAKPFRILAMTFNEDFTVGLSLVEHQDSFYTWATKTQAVSIPATNLPNPYSVQAPSSLTLDDQLIQYNDGTVIVALDITVGASPDSFVDYYQIEYKKSSDTSYIIHSQATGLIHRVLNVIDQEVYDVRVKAVNTLGVSSTYTSAQRTIVGAILPPNDVQDFACNIVGQTAHLSWSPVPDLDLAYYAINYSSVTSGATWNNSFPLISKVSRPATSVSVPARVGSYLIKAVDKLGNFSSNETIISTNVSAIGNFNAVATQTEDPDFTGVKTNVVKIEEGLTLDTSEQFDDNITDNFDDITTRLFDSGTQGANLYGSGTYAFSSVIDIGSVQTSRVTASITQTATDTDRIFDFVSGNFDSQPSNFDGDASVKSNSHLEIALSDDNITYTSFRNFNVGDYRARYYKFRLYMSSDNNSATPIVSELSVTVDMEDRIFSGDNIVSGAGTKTVTFVVPFYNVNYALGVTAEDMATGDYFEISNRNVNGFDIVFKNSSGTAISKVFDYLAKGY